MSYVEKTVEQPPNAFNSSILERSVPSLLPHLSIYPLAEDHITSDRVDVQKVAFEQPQNSSFSKKLSAKTTVQKPQPYDIHQMVLSLQYAIDLLTQYPTNDDRDSVRKVAFEQQSNKLCSTKLSATTTPVQNVQKLQPHDIHQVVLSLQSAIDSLTQYPVIDDSDNVQKVAFEQQQNKRCSINLSAKTTSVRQPQNIQAAASLLQTAINVLTLPTECKYSSMGVDTISVCVVKDLSSQTNRGGTTTKTNTSYVTPNLSSNSANGGRGLNVSGRGGRGRRRGKGCRRRGGRGGRRVARARSLRNLNS